MAGLLNYNPDPVGMGLLSAGAALMTPRAMGGGLGPGLLAFNQGAMQAQMMRRQQQQDALREQLAQAQIGEYDAQAQERRMKTEQMRAQLEREARIRSRLASPDAAQADAPQAMPTAAMPTMLGTGAGMFAPGGAMPPTETPTFNIGGPAQQQPSQGARPTRMSAFNEYMRLAKIYEGEGDLASGVKFREMAQKSMPELSRQEVVVIGGKPTIRNYFKDGTYEDITDAAPKASTRLDDFGGTKVLRDEYTGGTIGAPIPVTMTEAQKRQDANERSRIGLSAADLQFRRQEASRPLFDQGSGAFVYRPSAEFPTGTFVQPRSAEGAPLPSRGSDIAKIETDLRKELADLPQVKKYTAAVPAYNAIADAATRNNKQADINLVYGLAKLYDPESVVREGEYDTIANSQTIPEWIKGAAASLTGMGGRLTPATRAQILTEARGRLSSYEGEYNQARSTYERIAKDRGANPANVTVPIGATVGQRGPTKTIGGKTYVQVNGQWYEDGGK